MNTPLLDGIRKAAGWQYPVVGGSIGALASLPFAIPRFKERETAKGIGIVGAGAAAGTALGLLANRIAVNRVIKANKSSSDFAYHQALDNRSDNRYLSRAAYNYLDPKGQWQKITDSGSRQREMGEKMLGGEKGKVIKKLTVQPDDFPFPLLEVKKHKGNAIIRIVAENRDSANRYVPYGMRMPIRSREGLKGSEIVKAILDSNKEHVAAGGLYPGERLTFSQDLLDKLREVTIKV